MTMNRKFDEKTAEKHVVKSDMRSFKHKYLPEMCGLTIRYCP